MNSNPWKYVASDKMLGSTILPSLTIQPCSKSAPSCVMRYSTYVKDGVTKEVCRDFSETEIREVVTLIDGVLDALPEATRAIGPSEDAPVAFNVTDLPDHLEHLAGNASAQVGNFIATLAMRIRMMLADRRLGPLIAPDTPVSLEQWLEAYVGQDRAADGPIAVLDLSLVSSDVVHIAVAVIARLVFEATQRHRRLNEDELPTVLVLEEAHSFVRRSRRDEENTVSPTTLCRQTFERIAREGRKFGLGLVLSSQRPDEISPTVLGQCNTFILHRIVNDQDQQLVGRIVPDNLGSLLRELPSLPSRQAVMFDIEFIDGVEEPYYKTEFGSVEAKVNKIALRTMERNRNGESALGDVETAR